MANGSNNINDPPGLGQTDNWYLFYIASHLYLAQSGALPFYTTASTTIADDWNTVPIVVAGGSGFTTLPNAAARAVMIISSIALDLQRNGGSGSIVIPANTAVTIAVKENAAEIGLRKNDQSAGPTTTQVGAVYQS